MAFFKKKKETPAAESKPADTLNQFKYNGKQYNVLRGAVVPREAGGSDKLTAADICVDTEAQKYLVENGCSAVEEVV